MDKQEQLLSDYKTKATLQREQIQQLKRVLNMVSLSRLGIFIVEVLLFFWFLSTVYTAIIGALMILPVIGFMVLVKRQLSLQQEMSYAEHLLWVYENEIGGLEHNKNGYSNGTTFEDEQHHYASDLDIYGQASLYALTNRCNTHEGLNLLAESLGRPYSKQTIEQRQESLSELVAIINQTFHFRAELHGHKPEQLEQIKDKLVNHLGNQLQFTKGRFIRTYTALVPYMMLAAFAVAIIVGGYVWNVFGLLSMFNIACLFYYKQELAHVYLGFGNNSQQLNGCAAALKWIEEINWKSNYINGLFSAESKAEPVSKKIKELSKIINAFDAQLNFIVGAVLNVFMLWGLRCSIRLDKWYSSSSSQIIEGLDRIGRFEELISMATLTYNQPEWHFPVLREQYGFKATDLGHPLILKKSRIANDFDVENHCTVDIITGSNMAGKSTFLRTVGINMVLAYAGAPVCAGSMELSIVEVLTYMRIKDSLNDQTSTFKAELNRLKMILDTIAVSGHAFVLIDEMLRGTNSRDKYLGSKVFVERLIGQGTPALLATHDLQLADMKEANPKLVRNYHFDIKIDEGEMYFDYKLKLGPCRTFNAAVLLKEIGLSLTEEA